jgi:hypothetical protein
MEDWVDESEFVRKSETNGIAANAVDDLEWAEVWFRELVGRSSRLDVFRQEEDLIAWSEVWGQNAAIVGSGLITLLS